MWIREQCKRAWARALLHGVHYEDRHRQLDVLYRFTDPWGLDCDREKFRFAVTNAIIAREFGRLGSLLEVGCGEGLQTKQLGAVCDRRFGIDVSSTAIARARTRCPEVKFAAGHITMFADSSTLERFDLVVACEVLYYVKAVDEFLDCMSRLGRACLVSYYAPHEARLAPLITQRRNVQSELIRHEQTEWIISWWTNSPTGKDGASAPDSSRNIAESRRC
jgi:2-polyprenyl-3-methyl-5-hydroxy-6-metoxy-1,4-benzoquinol methylase